MTNEHKATHIVDMCQRFQRAFTLGEIVDRVLEERPELMFEFSEIWGALVQRRVIILASKSVPSTYRVAGDA